jgi:cytochrome c5
VYAGSTGAAAQAAAVAAAATQAASQVAYGGTMDGSVIFNQLCTGCHTSGAGGAPTLTAAGMGARVSKGAETLHKHAIEGFTGTAGVMPPKGGNPALTDDQVKARLTGCWPTSSKPRLASLPKRRPQGRRFSFPFQPLVHHRAMTPSAPPVSPR